MKKYILSVIAIMASVFSMSAEEKKVYSLFVNTVSGEKIEYAFEKKPVATFEGENMIITVADAPGVEYPMSDIENITLEGKLSGIADASVSADMKITLTDSFLRVIGIDAGAPVRIYSANGSLVASTNADSFGMCEISLENLVKGIYVVAAPGHSFKFVK
ncbi:MAG: hypothetical protein K2N05_05315 [Muribaculaceae bacterium]|nr:hypothetical protein [Muribaculaceae bacterium]